MPTNLSLFWTLCLHCFNRSKSFARASDPEKWYIKHWLIQSFFNSLYSLYFPSDAPTAIHAPTKVTVNEDSLAVMECSAEGNPLPLITWSRQNRWEVCAGTLIIFVTLPIENSNFFLKQLSIQLVSFPEGVRNQSIKRASIWQSSAQKANL